MRLPGGAGELTLSPVGQPTLLDGFRFQYHLADDPNPAMAVSINLQRPLKK